MSAYYIQKLHIHKLWGYRNIELSFFKDVNIIIGPNASGKTTLLNLLRYILNLDLIHLRDIEFAKVEISFKGFEDNSIRTIIVQTTETSYIFTVSKKEFVIPIDPIPREYKNAPVSVRARIVRQWKNVELEQAINEIAKAVWLPVSRRLPVSEEDDVRERYPNLESVDVRLRELFTALKSYRQGLDSKLSVQYKDFEKKVLREILYNKEYDQIGSFSLEAPKPEDKNHLLRAFEVAGLLDQTMRKRIDEHFLAAEQAVKAFKENILKGESTGLDQTVVLEIVFILPLLRRTKSIVEYARKLEDDRNQLFSPLNKFEKIVNNYLQPKWIDIEDSGELSIHSPKQKDVEYFMLSSGEKQILILLIQALVREDEPVIYVADEPELSLHVKWQENLLNSLVELTKNLQIIVATHSPDIVGQYTDKVIDLGRLE